MEILKKQSVTITSLEDTVLIPSPKLLDTSTEYIKSCCQAPGTRYGLVKEETATRVKLDREGDREGES